MTTGKISAGHSHNMGRRNHAEIHLLPWHTAQHVNQQCWGRGGEKELQPPEASLPRSGGESFLGKNLPTSGEFVHPRAAHSKLQAHD